MKREHWWPVGIVTALALTVGVNVVVFVLAAQGDGAGAVPDYYQRAIAWDSTRAEAARSDSLGWGLRAALAAPSGDGAAMTIGLTDAAGRPVEGARVRIAGYALAHAQVTRTDTVLTASGDGYAVRLPVPRVEWYEFRLTADRGAQRFVAELRCLPGQTCRPA